MPDARPLLDEPLKSGEALIWHLCHSGTALRTASRLLVFDYSNDSPARVGRRSLGSGVVEPSELRGLDVVVFISHEHGDHFHPGCLEWRRSARSMRFVVAPEVAQADGRFCEKEGLVTVLAPEKTADVDGMTVTALKSTDSGVGFLVKTDGLTIYHAGDLAWWNWDDEPHTERTYLESDLRALHGETIDVAFQLADPRLRGLGWGGLFAFAKKFDPRILVPIHFGTDYASCREARRELKKRAPGAKFWCAPGRGACVRFGLEGWRQVD